mgnify:CR=1 FL=1
MNTELLKEKAFKIHGNRYILDDVVYDKKNRYIFPVCREHGVFKIRYDHFLSGCGCKLCANENLKKIKTSTTAEFKEKLENRFPQKYDTSKVEYINAETPVILICHEKDEFGNEHGEFKATPHNILRGCGCPKCIGKYVNDKDSFLKRVNDIFGENINIDFSKFIYTKSNKKATFICHEKDKFGNEHGEFKMTPNNFLRGERCPKCRKHIIKDTSYFIKESKLIYGENTFDYSKTEYVNDKTNVILICHKKDEFGNEHGEFKIKPYNHLRQNCGCKKCSSVTELTQDSLEKRVNKLYDNKYDLSLVNVSKGDGKKIITVICHEKDKDGIEHGEFKTTPQRLLSGHSCPKCGLRNNVMELKLFNFLKKEFEIVIHNYHNKEIFGSKSIDCFIPKFNIAVECQGLQHFEPIKRFGGLDEFIKIQERDEQKYRQCIENGIKIFYFKNTKKDVTYKYKLYNTFKSLLKAIKEEIKNEQHEKIQF